MNGALAEMEVAGFKPGIVGANAVPLRKTLAESSANPNNDSLGLVKPWQRQKENS